MSSSECCSNPPTLNPSSGTGHVENLGGLDSYVTGSPHSKLALLLVSDVFGFEAPNLRKLADKVAAAGFFVVVPNFFNKDPYSPEDANRPLPVWIKDHRPMLICAGSAWQSHDYLCQNFLWLFTTRLIPPFVTMDKGFEDAKLVLEALTRKGISSIGAAGFCWGAKVLCHPTFVTVDDIKEVKVPVSILGAEFDRISPPEVVKQFEEVLTAKSEVKSHVKIFAKVSHGWTVRYNVEDEAACKSAEEAHQDLLEWLLNHVKGVTSSL